MMVLQVVVAFKFRCDIICHARHCWQTTRRRRRADCAEADGSRQAYLAVLLAYYKLDQHGDSEDFADRYQVSCAMQHIGIQKQLSEAVIRSFGSLILL